MEKVPFEESFKKFKTWWLRNQSGYLRNNSGKDFKIHGVYRDKVWVLKMMTGADETANIATIEFMYENNFWMVEKRGGKKERHGLDSTYGELTNVGAIVRQMQELNRQAQRML